MYVTEMTQQAHVLCKGCPWTIHHDVSPLGVCKVISGLHCEREQTSFLQRGQRQGPEAAPSGQMPPTDHCSTVRPPNAGPREMWPRRCPWAGQWSPRDTYAAARGLRGMKDLHLDLVHETGKRKCVLLSRKLPRVITCELAAEGGLQHFTPSHKSQEKITVNSFHRHCKEKQKFIIYIYIPSAICILWH